MIFSGRKTEYPKRKSDSGVNFYMNKKEIAEIKKQFTPQNCALTRLCACYVDGEKNKKSV